MTETSADWVERPRPADVAALTTRPLPRPRTRRDRAVQQASTTPDVRVVGALAGLLALAAALLLRQRRRR